MRIILLVLISFITLSAIPVGLLMMYDPAGTSVGLSVSLLGATPFQNYFIPGLLLALVVGGTSLVALFLVMNQSPAAYKMALTTGIITMGWTLGQFIFFPYHYMIRGVYLAAGIVITLTAYQLMGKAAF